MTEKGQILEQCRELFALRENKVAASQRLEELEQSQRQAIYDCREAKQTLREYEGSFKSFLHGFSGRKEETLDMMQRQVSASEAARSAAAQEKARLESELVRMENRVRTLEEALAGPVEDDLRRDVAELEIPYLIRRILALLERNEAALLSAHEWGRPEIRMGREHEHGLYGSLQEADRLAADVKAGVDKLNEFLNLLEQEPVHSGNYFDNPAGFIVALAAQYGMLDRIRTAQGQIISLRKLLKQILISTE